LARQTRSGRVGFWCVALLRKRSTIMPNRVSRRKFLGAAGTVAVGSLASKANRNMKVGGVEY
jgi:hypothetical protein